MYNYHLYESYDLTSDKVFDELMESPEHIMFVKTTNFKKGEVETSIRNQAIPDRTGWIDLMADRLECGENVGAFCHDNKDHVGFTIVKVMYNNRKYYDPEKPNEQTETRYSAITNLFARWGANNNTHNAKDPFKCSSFCEWIKSTPFTKSDYVLFMVA